MVPPSTIILPTAYGRMLVDQHDLDQTNALFKTGLAIDHAEIALLAQVLQLLGAGLIFVDVAACFGTYILGLAPFVGPLRSQETKVQVTRRQRRDGQ